MDDRKFGCEDARRVISGDKIALLCNANSSKFCTVTRMKGHCHRTIYPTVRVYTIEELGTSGPKMGSWQVCSKKDTRWNNNGRTKGLATAGGPPEMHEWIDECKEKYGEPPDDLNLKWEFRN